MFNVSHLLTIFVIVVLFLCLSVLALDITLVGTVGVCSCATQTIYKFTFSYDDHSFINIISVNLKHAGVSDILIRTDQLLVATAGWDRR